MKYLIIEPMKTLGESMVEYYLEHGRALPWREDADPYKVHLSETMLQQTRVETVIPYYHRFLANFPDVASLASAEEEKVLKLWEGLGYYSRAKNLLRSARMVVANFDGHYPKNKEDLLSLPGIGDYTANAILSFCFDEPAIPVDGNFLRLFARLTGYSQNVLDTKAKKECEAYFLSQLGEQRPSLFAQACMEIGQMVCVPNGEPKCNACPLREYCVAAKENLQIHLPIRDKNMKKKEERKTVLIYYVDGKYGYTKRPEKGLLSGLYGFPMAEGHLSKKQAEAYVKKNGFEVKDVIPLKEYTHVFSHVKWDMKAFVIELKNEPDDESLLFFTLLERKDNIPLPSAFLPFEKQLLGLKNR